ncbi:N-methylhydantoinase B [Desulfocucumis palustris]|uniref:N-methylhydantoinase B n=1 Tax=Desulfocucumis palustris TaxID=1898651 RepID=A0A2L2XFW8_9FIRM|nr:hydantoinase B/oxoprolinase family protein [Desulfocucumis palustris]GBF35022.1 N-methylhydantoinase B [Desulfocucumis palustris]
MDPVTLEVIRCALQSAAEEMGLSLIRTALSPNIKDRRDCSTALYTVDGRMVAQAEHIPLHLGLMPTVVRAVLERFPPGSLNPGDAVIINDPYISGSHLPDVCVIAPLFYRGTPIALAANLAHHVDVGGAVPGSMSTSAVEIFQEGIRIPPVKLCGRGKLKQELVDLIANNVRTPEEFRGDIQAQLAANAAGERRIQELADRYGPKRLLEYMAEIIKYSEKRMRSGLAGLPGGIYCFEDFLEGDGVTEDKINIKVALTIKGDSVTVDFTGTHPQVSGPVNATRGVTLACVYYSLKAVVDPEIPSNHGMTAPIEVITPPGSLVNPLFPAAVAHANINTAQRIADAMLGALAQASPERVTAAGTGSMSNFTIGGIHPATGRYYSYVETYGGGQGAKSDQDGMDGVHVNMTNTMNTPVEIIELYYPLLVQGYGLLPDTGGAGKYRGGAGMYRAINILGEKAAAAVSTERSLNSPWGISGGLPGAPSRLSVNYKNGGGELIKSGKFTGTLQQGDAIMLETAGGGGFGSPLERDPENVRRDVLEELVSKRRAEEIYGVIFKEGTLEIDTSATAEKRNRLSIR